MEIITLVAAIVAALGGMGAAWIASRSTKRQVDAARSEGEKTRRQAAALAEQARLQAEVDRYVEWSLTGPDDQKLHAIRQLEHLADAGLSQTQASAVYEALRIAHDERFAELDGPDPPDLPTAAESLAEVDDNGPVEGSGV